MGDKLLVILYSLGLFGLLCLFAFLRVKETKMKKQIKYWLWILNGKPIGKPPQLYKEKLIREYGRAYLLSNLVETGTYEGETINALKNNFTHIYSIELDEALFNKACIKFLHSDNIMLFQGDSAKVLKKLLPLVKKPALFWLDAHYSGKNTAKGKKETPILEELKLIFNNSENHIILIDDMDNFGEFESIKDGYPSQVEITKLIPRSYYFFVKNKIGRILPK